MEMCNIHVYIYMVEGSLLMNLDPKLMISDPKLMIWGGGTPESDIWTPKSWNRTPKPWFRTPKSWFRTPIWRKNTKKHEKVVDFTIFRVPDPKIASLCLLVAVLFIDFFDTHFFMFLDPLLHVFCHFFVFFRQIWVWKPLLGSDFMISGSDFMVLGSRFMIYRGTPVKVSWPPKVTFGPQNHDFGPQIDDSGRVYIHEYWHMDDTFDGILITFL